MNTEISDTSPSSIFFYDDLRDNFDTARYLIQVVAEYCANTDEHMINSIQPGRFDQNSLHRSLSHALSLLETTSSEIDILWEESQRSKNAPLEPSPKSQSLTCLKKGMGNTQIEKS